jgi:Pvc16 N-terminal domain
LIQLIDEAVEAHLRREVPLPEASVDISFAAPDRAWGAAVTRPTVNIFLWDIRRNMVRTTAGLAQQGTDGQVERRPTNPVIDLRYVVTAWAAEHRDEHQLLGSVLTCILAHSSVPADILPPQLPTASSLSLGLASEEARVTGEFWSSLDGRLKPGLQLVVSLPLDIFGWVAAGPPTRSVGVAAQRMGPTLPDPGTIGRGGGPKTRVGNGHEPALRRRRSSGALTMEGRSSTEPASSEPASSGPAPSKAPSKPGKRRSASGPSGAQDGAEEA